MQVAHLRVLLFALTTGAVACFLPACGGDTGGEGDSYDGSAYNDDTGGDIRLVLNENTISVGDTTGFRVKVNNAAGTGVANLQIACDTETGLALIEPTSGYELTDSEGQMSGRVGCVTPGSYQIGCRMPVGANQRSFERIICEGPVPAGFNGFPGAGGGNLGVGNGGTGGAVPPANNGSVLVTGTTISESGEDTISIDVQQNICSVSDKNNDGDTTDPGEIDYETFTDTTVSLTVKNETAETINFSSLSYKVSGAAGTGTSFSSNRLALLSGGSVAPGATATLQTLFLRANNGRKYFTGSSSPISTSTGFRNVTFTLYGISSAGESYEVSAAAGLSFNDYNKCG